MKRVNPVKMYGATTSPKTNEQKETETNMYDTNNAEMTPVEMVKKYHATLMVLSNMIKSFHYCVTGSDFYVIHPKLDECYMCVEEYIDCVAEAVVAHGYVPVLHLSEALQMSMIAEHSFSGQITCKEAVTILHNVYDTLASVTKDMVPKVENSEMPAVAGILGEHHLYYEKAKWMMRAYLRG